MKSVSNKYFTYATKIIAAFIIIFFIIWLSSSYHLEESYSNENNVRTVNTISSYNTDTVSGGKTNLPFSIKNSYEGEVFTVDFKLPKVINDNDIFFFFSNYSDIEATVDGITIYTQNTSGKYPLGIAMNHVSLFKEHASKTMTVKYTAYTKATTISQAYIGNRSAIYLDVLKNNDGTTFFYSAAIIIAVILIIIGIIFRKKHTNMITLINSGKFLLVTFGWGLTELNTAILLNGNRAGLYFISFALFMLIPVMLISILENSLKRKYKVYRVLSFAFVFNEITCFLLHMSGVLPLYRSIVFHYLIIVIFVAVTLYKLVVQVVQLKFKEISITFVMHLLLYIAIFVGIFQLLYSDGYSRKLILYCLAICFCISTLNCFWLIEKTLKETSKAKYYETLSLIDEMTGLYNRNCYEKKLSRLEEFNKKNINICFVMIDVDNFKMLNDEYGHVVGDKFLVIVSECLRNTFECTGECFRIGGDEFAIVLQDIEEIEIRKMIDDFNNDLANISCELSVSCGYCCKNLKKSNGSIRKQLVDVINLADQQMYQDKQLKKERNN